MAYASFLPACCWYSRVACEQGEAGQRIELDAMIDIAWCDMNIRVPFELIAPSDDDPRI